MIRRITVVCVGNICRSPMAEALLRAELPADSEVSSAGIGALVGAPADPLAVSLMAERNIDLAAHSGRQLDENILRHADLLLVMEQGQADWIEGQWPQARGRVFRWGHWGDFDIPDPYRQGEAVFREALVLIDKGLQDWKDKLGGD